MLLALRFVRYYCLKIPEIMLSYMRQFFKITAF